MDKIMSPFKISQKLRSSGSRSQKAFFIAAVRL